MDAVCKRNRRDPLELEGLWKIIFQIYLLVYIAIMPAKVPVKLVCVALDWPTILSMAANCFWYLASKCSMRSFKAVRSS